MCFTGDAVEPEAGCEIKEVNKENDGASLPVAGSGECQSARASLGRSENRGAEVNGHHIQVCSSKV